MIVGLVLGQGGSDGLDNSVALQQVRYMEQDTDREVYQMWHRLPGRGRVDVPLASPTPVPPQGRGQATPTTEPSDQGAVDELAVRESQGALVQAFFSGYKDGGAPYPEGRIDAMIQCESGWRIDPGGYHFGLAQFDPGTWATVSAITGLADWRNPYHQGYNVAVWSSMISPGTTAGWPYCWWAW